MREIAYIIIIFILAATGLALFRSGTRAYIAGGPPFILISAKNKESIEHTVRRAVRMYPESTVYITDRSGDPEMGMILAALEKDIENVKIINRRISV